MALCLDTHCHLDASEFDFDRLDVVDHAVKCGIDGVLIPAIGVHNFDVVKNITHQVSDQLPASCYTLGIHPISTSFAKEADILVLRKAVEKALIDPRFVGIGEIGLDYFLPELDFYKQAYFFEAQLDLAEEFNLPVILHVRRSQDAIIKALKNRKISGGIAHAFNGSLEQAKNFLKLNFVLGFGGAMTYVRALQIRRLAQELPFESLVLETDAPDIPPSWLTQGANRRNQPSELSAIASVLAELRQTLISQTKDICAKNALRVLPRWQSLLD